MREHMRKAPGPESLRAVQSVWIDQAKEHLDRLLELVGAAHARQGGTFAVQLRDALEARILHEVGGRCELTDDTEEKSLSVHVTPNGVLVDVRLKIGRWQQ